MFYLPITNGSTCCPAELYHGGRPAVYMVLVWLRRMDSEDVFLEDCDIEAVRCRLDLGDFCEPVDGGLGDWGGGEFGAG